MLILGIESSCDETAAAVVEDARICHGSIVASQIDVHRAFGGVIPELAAREHLKVVDVVVQDAMKQAGVGFDAIDAIAVTQGPGLIGALLVGVSYAKGLALSLAKPLVPVDHVHAHIHGALLGLDVSDAELYPCIAAVVSGGHTNLYYMTSPTSFELLAYTIDDACGECFDKVAKLFGLGYPGGPVIEKLARQGTAERIPMPRMVEQKSRMVFSYSGLKTHMVNLRNKEKSEPTPERLADICAAFQDEALGQMARKLELALAAKPDTRAILIAGGVAANRRFQQIIRDIVKVPAHFPRPEFCSDNGAMIAAFGYHLYRDQLARGAATSRACWDAYSRYQY